MSVTGDFTQTSTGTFVENIASLSNFAQLLVSGSVNLDGTLDINLLDGYTPNVGDSFTFIDPSSFNGMFASIDLTGGSLPGNDFFALVPGSNTLELCLEDGNGCSANNGPPPAVPEPASLLLLASALAASALLARSRTKARNEKLV